MDWLPPTIASRPLLPLPREGDGGVLFLFPVETKEGKRAAAALLPRAAVIDTILEHTAVMVTTDDLRSLAAIPEVLAADIPSSAAGVGSRQEYLAVISPLDVANSAIYINYSLDNPSIESQTYHLLWIMHALSSNDKDRVSKILRPLRGSAIDELKNKPARVAEEIGKWTAEYKADLSKLLTAPEEISEAARLRRSLVLLNRLPVFPPMPDIGEKRREDLRMVFSLLGSDERNRLYATLVKSPSYAYLIREFAGLKIALPEYQWRMRTLAGALRAWRHEERRVIMPRIENRREELSSLSGRRRFSPRGRTSSPPREISPLSPRGRTSSPPREISPLSPRGRTSSPLDVKEMPKPLEPVGAESPYVFTLRELEAWKAATIRTQANATEMMQLFTGGVLDGIDLSGAVITGSSIPASIYRPWGHSTRCRVGNTSYYPLRAEDKWEVKQPPDDMAVIFSFLILRYPAYAAYSRDEEKKLRPASDIDIAVIDEKGYSAIAGRILHQLQTKYPRLEVSVREGRQHPIYNLTDPDMKIRPIQIYPASLAQILTHHTAPVRGWYDTHTDTFHISASAALSYVTRGIDDYYYFAGRDPVDIIGAINDRGFNINLAQPLSNVISQARFDTYGIPIIQYRDDLIRYHQTPYSLVQYGGFGFITSDLTLFLAAKGDYLKVTEKPFSLGDMGIIPVHRPVGQWSAFVQRIERELMHRLRAVARSQRREVKRESPSVVVPPFSSLPTREAFRLPLPGLSPLSSPRSTLPEPSPLSSPRSTLPEPSPLSSSLPRSSLPSSSSRPVMSKPLPSPPSSPR